MQDSSTSPSASPSVTPSVNSGQGSGLHSGQAPVQAPAAAPTSTSAPAATPTISIDDFKKLEFRIGKILNAERIPNADKLLKLTVDVGEATGPRQILSGIAEWYTPESLIGRSCPFITNLAPRTIRGLESNGMILACGADTAVLLAPDKEVPPGTLLR